MPKSKSHAQAVGNIVNIHLPAQPEKPKRAPRQTKPKQKKEAAPAAPAQAPKPPRFHGSGRVGSSQEQRRPAAPVQQAARQPYVGAPASAAQLAALVGGYVKTSQPIQVDVLDALRGRINKLEQEQDRLYRLNGVNGFARSLSEASQIANQRQAPPPYREVEPIIQEFEIHKQKEKREEPSMAIGSGLKPEEMRPEQHRQAQAQQPALFTREDSDEEHTEEEQKEHPPSPEPKPAVKPVVKPEDKPEEESSDEEMVLRPPVPKATVQGTIEKLRMANTREQARAIINGLNDRPRASNVGKLTLVDVCKGLSINPKKANGSYKTKEEMITSILGSLKLEID